MTDKIKSEIVDSLEEKVVDLNTFISNSQDPHSKYLLKKLPTKVWKEKLAYGGLLLALPIPFFTWLINASNIEHPLFYGQVVFPILSFFLFGYLALHLKYKQKQIQKFTLLLKNQIDIDPMTGLYNRRKFYKVLDREIHRAQRENIPLSLIFFDIDHFKQVNDQYGHDFGDQVIKYIAEILQSSCRKYDIPTRWGGEEFVILLLGSDQNSAFIFGDRIRNKFASHPMELNGDNHYFTLSGGISTLEINDDIESFIQKADEAMCLAKQSGRNKICSSKEIELDQESKAV